MPMIEITKKHKNRATNEDFSEEVIANIKTNLTREVNEFLDKQQNVGIKDDYDIMWYIIRHTLTQKERNFFCLSNVIGCNVTLNVYKALFGLKSKIEIEAEKEKIRKKAKRAYKKYIENHD